jgi:hypothetical protein
MFNKNINPKQISQYMFVDTTVENTSAATAANYGVFFVAPFICEIVEAWETHAAAGTSGSAVTLTLEKLSPGVALDSGVQVLNSTWDLKASALYPRRVRAASSLKNRTLSIGNRLALKDSGTLTSVGHVNVTVLLKIFSTNVSSIDNPTS